MAVEHAYIRFQPFERLRCCDSGFSESHDERSAVFCILVSIFDHVICSSFPLPCSDVSLFKFYSINVDNMQSKSVIVQNTITTFVSFQPPSSK